MTTNKKQEGSPKTSLQKKPIHLCCCLLFLLCTGATCLAQQDSIKTIKQHKNIIRYELSGALLFGIDRYAVFGYERVLGHNQSISVNIGRVSLPKLISISTDSLNLSKDQSSSGFNASVDYRFYLGNENKKPAPHGVYVGPYYSYNHFTRDNRWDFINSSTNSYVNTHTNFNISTAGLELGYQFVFWNRLAVDMVMFGPGLGFYNYKATFEGNVDSETREQLFDGLKQLLTQKFPGMNFVFADKEFSSNGTIRTSTIGYRYLVHIGFNF